MKRSPLPLLLIVLTGLMTEPSRAASINWSSRVIGNHIRQDGNPIDSQFRFELGSFREGFVPSPANVSQWPQYWVLAQRVDYSTEFQYFGEQYHYHHTTQNGIRPGQRAYIWGYDRQINTSTTDSTAEWILLSDSAWLWPYPDDLLPLTWIAESASESFLESHQSPEGQLRMTSVILTPTDNAAIAWLHETLGQNARWHDDPDNDGIPNSVEYVLGTNPSKASENYLELKAGKMETEASLSITRSPRLLKLDISLDLQDWQEFKTWNAPLPGPLQIDIPNADSSQLFIRLSAEL